MGNAVQPGVVAIAADHAGFELKGVLVQTLRDLGHEVRDLGTENADSVDYPAFAAAVVDAVSTGAAPVGVIVCGTGIGIAMAANRHRAIRAAVCHSVETARLARQHNDANVLALGARVTDPETAKACLRVFLRTPFEGGRHARRVEMMS